MTGLFLLGFPLSVSSNSFVYVPDDYPTIQMAINGVSEGDTLLIRSGIYPENLIIDKSITLQGVEGVEVIIDGQNKGSTLTVQGGNVVTLTELTIVNGSGTQNGELTYGGGIYNSGDIFLDHIVIKA
jgi:nitrous oxidase accessory protein NosD